ncbi:response regulator transcription factor [Shewanella surugensis]|uniref:Helix-turn-helix transcriptional regulator n=1 Tax=Shewanella surugensis TaxID=212020 RepID=A0ABT0L5P9_9GAMM|nr:helix-turn-helix transcriptional regulator [Shewanella surugensis]MCL1123016.1 helix-turn-helix transcriptional regulator [Shewanella surugensis]
MSNIDICIADLYRLAATSSSDYRRRALAQIAQVIDFDGALWGCGRLDSDSFHSVDVLGVDETYSSALAQTKTINPFFEALKKQPGVTLDMSSVLADELFYSSSVYIDFFSQYGVERIIGILLPDASTGIVDLISLYRFEKHNPFSLNDTQNLDRLGFHLVSSASHYYFLHLTQRKKSHAQEALAICDKYGLFFEAQPRFMALLRQYYPQYSSGHLPFSVFDHALLEKGLQMTSNAFGDLYCIALWETRTVDLLSLREKEVVKWVTKGLSFKEAAREMGVAPSTVSNHLYKIYRKLNIASRTELAQLETQTQ